MSALEKELQAERDLSKGLVKANESLKAELADEIERTNLLRRHFIEIRRQLDDILTAQGELYILC